MLFYLTVILACQLLGELLTAWLHLPVPGPVIGMVILFVGLSIRGFIPEGLGNAGNSLLANMSLFYVPAGVGIMANVALIKANAVALIVSIIVSSLVCLVVTGFVMSLLMRSKRKAGK